MKLSVIIVNYNVKYFLQQCLTSVFVALKKVDGEVWVVDNNSVDKSVEMIRKNFPEVKLIANKENVGFSKANNQAIRKANGEYILLLNPDTVVEEDTFAKVVDFMDKHPDAGGLGVKMIDGKGKFLPESKRGIPTPEVAFYKIFGLTKFFPHSKRFARYYLGHLDKDKTHKVEILSGAFMLLRKKVLDEIGLLDEEFFMYGEDIDLSYRILKAGYNNYYFADTTIVHYKGESTKKGSLNYVFIFYKAMIIFARKHFSGKKAGLLMFMIKIAIVLRAALAVMRRIFQRIYLPVIDAVLIFLGFYFFVPFWENVHLNTNYPQFIWYMLPAYIVIWLITSYYTGAYDNPGRLKSVLNGIGLGTAIILIIYALIDVRFRFSRVVILWGALFAAIEMITVRLLLHWAGNFTGYKLFSKSKRKILIVGKLDESRRVHDILNKISANIDVVGYVNPDNKSEEGYLGKMENIREIIKIFKINEVIFCAKNLPMSNIITMMLKLSALNVSVKIAPEDSISIIGSNSINTSGDLYILELNTITTPENRRIKNLSDKILSFFFLIFYPVLVWFVKKKFGFLRNIFRVMFGKWSWVGFSENNPDLPIIKKGILSPLDAIADKNIDEILKKNLDSSYAKNYSLNNDLFIIFKGFKNLGR